ncbi:hypothetical protein FNZ56_08205 [Pseudoluteimonas lycopersici]|uniref:Uncharacterized protein n=1 Tax=Pseudoluteimonas lycopersici TaxID=1324796 RepID=A0A516V5Q7_9GAMM|nr:hypothetical protein [Lysobacter lycopersici]QDQ73860.1 hypothetical protein FNZ56_08205 [Lysobacter lycopersici]
MTRLTKRHFIARAIGCAPILLLGLANTAWATSDVLVSPDDMSIVDIEFDTAGHSARYVYCQPLDDDGPGELYTGRVKLDGSLTVPTDMETTCAFVGNGPEWGQDSSGTFVVYMDYNDDDPNNPVLTISYIRPVGIAAWTSPFPVSTSPLVLASRNVVYPSQNPNPGSATRVVFMAQQANNQRLITQALDGTSRCTPLPTNTTGNFPRFSSYENFLMYTKVPTSGGTRELFKANMDLANCPSTQLTTDGLGKKTTASAWAAPELAGSAVYGVLMDDNNEATQYKVYSASGSNVVLTTVDSMDGKAFSSVETFQTGTSSYLLYATKSGAGTGNSNIYVANLHLDTGLVTQKKMSSDDTMLRSEPEVGFMPPIDGNPPQPRIYFSAHTDPGAEDDVLAVYRTVETDLP